MPIATGNSRGPEINIKREAGDQPSFLRGLHDTLRHLKKDAEDASTRLSILTDRVFGPRPSPVFEECTEAGDSMVSQIESEISKLATAISMIRCEISELERL